MIRPARPTGYLAALFVLDILCVQLAIPIAMQLRYVLPFGRTVLPEWAEQLFYAPTIWLHVTVFLVWTTCLILASVYTPRKVAFWGEEFQRLLLGHTAAALILAGTLYLAKAELPRLMFIYFVLLALLLLMATRLAMRFAYRVRHKPTVETMRLLLAGAGAPAEAMASHLQENDWPGLEIVGIVLGSAQRTARLGVLPVLGTLDETEKVIAEQRADAVLIALGRDSHDLLADLVTRLNRLPVRLYVVPDYFDLAFFDATIEQLGTIPVIGLRDPAIDGLQRILKRVMDIVVSALTLLIASPLMLVTALAIKLEDGGPVFYRATRVGENGRVFHMLKFRSMVVNAERLQAQMDEVAAQGGVYKSADDPRVTRVGRVIRRTSVDELPQLLNVLRGEMSLVGPRPELPGRVDLYATWQHKRFAVPQGMTGWWQVNARTENPLALLNTEEDLYYVQNYSIWLDLRILWRTVAVVLRGRGSV